MHAFVACSSALLFCSLNSLLCFALSNTIPAAVALLGHTHKKVFTLWIPDNVFRTTIRYQRMKREIQAIVSHFSANRECLLHSGVSSFARTNQDKTMTFVPYYESYYTGIGETQSHWLHLLDSECAYMKNYADRVVIIKY